MLLVMVAAVVLLLLLLVMELVFVGCVVVLLLYGVVAVLVVVEDERAKSTTECPIVFIAPVECELYDCCCWGGSNCISLPTTKVTFSTMDFKVATACSCETFSKFFSDLKKKERKKD